MKGFSFQVPVCSFGRHVKLLQYQAPAVLTISKVSGSYSAHGFPGTHLLQHWWLQLCQYQGPAAQAASSVQGSQQQGAASSFPQHPLGLFPSRVPSVKYLLGNNFSYTPETSVAATSLPFLAFRPGVERRSSSLGILLRLSSGWSFRVLFTSI